MTNVDERWREFNSPQAVENRGVQATCERESWAIDEDELVKYEPRSPLRVISCQVALDDPHYSRFVPHLAESFFRTSTQLLRGMRFAAVLTPLSRTIIAAFRRRSLSLFRFEERMIERKALEIRCPFTGKIVSSRSTIPLTTRDHLYRFDASHTFYFGFYGKGIHATQLLYFPLENLVITNSGISDKTSQPLHKEVARFRLHMLRHAARVLDYLADRTPRQVVARICETNYAHHIYNELAGLDRFQSQGLLGEIDRYWVTGEPLGRLSSIYQEIRDEQCVYPKINYEQQLLLTLESRAFLIRCSDEFVTPELRDRILAVARRNLTPESMRQISDARSSNDVLLLLTFKCDDRTPVNQLEVVGAVIDAVAKRSGKVGIVCDGISLPVDPVKLFDEPHLRRLFAEENINAVDQVIEACQSQVTRKNVQFYSTNGRSLFEAFVWASQIDAYVAHYGSMQHKIGWMTTAQGVVHGNESIIGSRLSHSSRMASNGDLSCHFVKRTAVRDDRSACSPVNTRRGRSTPFNYHLDPRSVVEPLLRALRRRSRWHPRALQLHERQADLTELGDATVRSALGEV